MQKTRKFSKSTLAVLALSIVLAVSLIVGATFAWFKAVQTSGTSTVTTGRLTVGLDGFNGAGASTTDGSVVLFNGDDAIVVPGQVIAIQDVDATFGSAETLTNIPVLLRMKVTFAGDKLGDTALTSTLSGLNGEFAQLGTSDGWYYYTSVIAAKTASVSLIKDGSITVPSTYVSPTDHDKTLTISLEVQICQADWTATAASVFTPAAPGEPTAAEVAAVFAVTYAA